MNEKFSEQDYRKLLDLLVEYTNKYSILTSRKEREKRLFLYSQLEKIVRVCSHVYEHCINENATILRIEFELRLAEAEYELKKSR